MALVSAMLLMCGQDPLVAAADENSSWSKARKIGMLKANMLDRQLDTAKEWNFFSRGHLEYLPTGKWKCTSIAIKKGGHRQKKSGGLCDRKIMLERRLQVRLHAQFAS